MSSTRSYAGSPIAEDEDPKDAVRRMMATVAAMTPEERERRGAEFFEILESLRAADEPPLMMDEINEEIRAARAELRARSSRS